MFITKFGIKQAAIDVGEYLVSCPSCECDNRADVMVISNYYHFYYVPIFPQLLTHSGKLRFCFFYITIIYAFFFRKLMIIKVIYFFYKGRFRANQRNCALIFMNTLKYKT